MAVGNMLRVLKGNQEALISPAHKEEYLKKGYSVINEDGSVLEHGVKSERTVKNELEAANKRIAELEAELRQYKEVSSSFRIEEPGEEQESGEGQEEKKRGRKSGLA